MADSRPMLANRPAWRPAYATPTRHQMGVAPLLGIPFLAYAVGLAALTGVGIWGLESFREQVTLNEDFWMRMAGGTLLGGAGVVSFYMSPMLPRDARILTYLVGVVGVGAGFYYLTKKSPPAPSPGTTPRPPSPEDYNNIKVQIEEPLPRSDNVGTFGLLGTYYEVLIRWSNLGDVSVPFDFRFRVTEVPMLTEAGRGMRDSIPSVTTHVVHPENNTLVLAPGATDTKVYEVERQISPWDATEIQFVVDIFNAFSGEWKEFAATSFVTRARVLENS